MNFQNFLLVAPILLFSMVAHEFAHGYAAKLQGDDTADRLGRITWNPAPHIDPFMTVILPLMTWFGGGFIFGGAKPVPVDPRNYRDLRRGDIIVSLAGVTANAILVIGAAVASVLFGIIGRNVPAVAETCAILQVMMQFGIFFNIILVYFNLLPIPPLDGSHVFKYLLPPRLALQYQKVGRFGILILIVLFMAGGSAFGRLMLPVMKVNQSVQQLVFPYIIPSQLLS
ncbi:MAG: site-2 protease family protein [Gemmatimonadaceae bacterium]